MDDTNNSSTSGTSVSADQSVTDTESPVQPKKSKGQM